ncbi:MAG: hypothetical protein LBE06_09120 [Azoarcus sp.]|jgi:hypothetical protein|nr:hypothetical protein [Azoarcus sp.]
MDVADLAQLQNEQLDALRVGAHKPVAPQADGKCLWCGEVLADGRRWCDAACRDEWERAERCRAVRGA